jgi:pimeloyl-ACP methyl ester carboxylesterase
MIEPIRALAAILICLFAAGQPSLAVAAPGPAVASMRAAGPPGETVWLTTPLGRQKARVFRSIQVSPRPRLVVALHGDAPFERPEYQYLFAQKAAAALNDTVVAAILRPGYTDADGDKSGGVRGATTGDNYTPEALASLASAIAQLKARYNARDITLVGHSGGAALAAELAERRPELATRAVLVGCPCDLDGWRLYMARKQLSPLWLLPVASLSPLKDAARLSPASRILLLVGEKDDVAPARFSNAFALAARRTGAEVQVQVLPGLGHNILLQPAVLDALTRFQGQACPAAAVSSRPCAPD